MMLLSPLVRVTGLYNAAASSGSASLLRTVMPRHPGVFSMRPSNESLNVKLSTVATFPKNYFLENLAVRSDNSVLVTVLNHQELWYVPASNDEQPVEPELLFTFPQPAMGIVEAEPDVFYISAKLRLLAADGLMTSGLIRMQVLPT